MIPLSPVGRALGANLAIDSTGQSLRVLRNDGTAAIYDAPSGRILQGSLQIGQVVNYRQIQLNVGLENVMFPLSGAIALFGVSAQENVEQQEIQIEALPSGVNGGTAAGRRFQLASLMDKYGLETNGQIWQHSLDLRGQALMGSNRLSGNLDLTSVQGGSFVNLRQGSLQLETATHRVITVGDQGTRTGVEALMNGVRGLGYEWGWHDFRVNAYGGRAASSTAVGLGNAGLANYDTTLSGFGLRRRVRLSDLSLGGNWFRGPQRSGTTLGIAYSDLYARNEFKVQGLLGYFSGLSLRSVLEAVGPGFGLLGGPVTSTAGVVEVQQVNQRVNGGAYGFSAVDSFTPFTSKILLLTGVWETYSRNFLIVREESRFSAVNRKSASGSLRPSRYISFSGSLHESHALLGTADLERGYSYGVNASTPGRYPFQLGYFRSVQTNNDLSSSRFALTQYFLQVPQLKRFSVNAMYTEGRFGNLESRSLNETVTADLHRFGLLGLHDQLQLRTSHNYGFDWSRQFKRGTISIRAGLERQTSIDGRTRLAPVAALRLPYFRGQTLVASYLNIGGSYVFRIETGGSLIRQRELAATNSQMVLIVRASLTGQVYFDVDLNGRFKTGVDQPLPEMRVWIDEETSTTTDASGNFRFDDLSAGTHRLRVATATLPATLALAQESLQVAVMPYRANRQDFRAIRTGKVQGTVSIVTMDEAGRETVKPLPDARIVATGNRDAFTEGDGTFLLGDLPPGAYQLKVDYSSVPPNFICKPEIRSVEVKPGESVGAVDFRLTRPVIMKSAPPRGMYR